MYQTIDQIVRVALLEKSYRTLHKYPLYLHFALDGLYRAKRDSVYRSSKRVKLKVSTLGAVPWPVDLLWFGRVGVPIGNRILTFVPDSSLSLNPTDHTNDAKSNLALQGFPLSASSGPSDDFYDFLSFTNLYFSNGLDMFRGGVGSFLAKHFRVNENARCFQLDSTMGCSHVYLEYFTTCTYPNSETVLTSPHVGIVLTQWIHFREAKFKFGAASAEARQGEIDYLNELDQALAAQSDITYNGIMDTLSEYTSWTINQ